MQYDFKIEGPCRANDYFLSRKMTSKIGDSYYAIFSVNLLLSVFSGCKGSRADNIAYTKLR